MFRAMIPCVVAAAGLCASAAAQNALGDGRGLENNDLSVTRFPNRVNPHDQWLERVRLRNAIVTGNAPGGLSFRGDVGYTAPNEFRGELGANDLFAFRRDSLYSGLTGYGIRGTEAMQWQFALTTDAQAPTGLLGSPAVRRFGTQDLDRDRPEASTVPGLRDSDLLRPDPIESEIEAIRAPGGTLMGSLRSTSAYTAARPSTPTILAAGQDESGRRFGVTASALEGIRLQELELPAWMAAEQGVPSATGIPSRVNPESTARPISPTRTSYDEVLERLRAGAAPTPPGVDTKPDWQQRLDEIRERLAPTNEPGSIDGAAEPTSFSPEVLELIRRAGGRADTLIAESSGRSDPYADHVRQAQDLLGTGRFFDAEERFTRALSLRGGDVPAQVGRLHAQLGAGMYLSASLNLRSLVAKHPEVTGVRYGPRLLPSNERLTGIASTLRANAREESAGALRRESALLLAYLGAQTGDRTLVREGLDAFGVNASPRDRMLVDLLRGVWLEPQNPAESDDAGR